MYVCICVPHECPVLTDVRRSLDFLEMEVVSHHVGARYWYWVCGKTTSTLNFSVICPFFVFPLIIFIDWRMCVCFYAQEENWTRGQEDNCLGVSSGLYLMEAGLFWKLLWDPPVSISRFVSGVLGLWYMPLNTTFYMDSREQMHKVRSVRQALLPTLGHLTNAQ